MRPKHLRSLREERWWARCWQNSSSLCSHTSRDASAAPCNCRRCSSVFSPLPARREAFNAMPVYTEHARTRVMLSMGLRMAIPQNRTELETRQRTSARDGRSGMRPSSAGISLLWMAALTGARNGSTAGTHRNMYSHSACKHWTKPV